MNLFYVAGSVTNLPHNNMVDLWTWLETKRAKMKLYFSELYLILNILRLIDVIAGSNLDCVFEIVHK